MKRGHVELCLFSKRMKRDSPTQSTHLEIAHLFLCCRAQPDCVRVSSSYLTHLDPWAKIKANSREMGSDKCKEYTSTDGGAMLVGGFISSVAQLFSACVALYWLYMCCIRG